MTKPIAVVLAIALGGAWLIWGVAALFAQSKSIWTACLAHAAVNALGGSLTAYLFLDSGQFLLTSYAGVLAWLPSGYLICLR